MAAFAFEDDINCFICRESVNYGDDYRVHLKVEHKMEYNIDFFMRKAAQEKLDIKNGVEPKHVEYLNVDEEEISKAKNEMDETIPIIINSKVKEKIEHSVKNAMDEMFSKIKNMCENGLEDDDNDDVEDFEYNEEEALKDEQKIWESFENLKAIVNNLTLPPELVQQIILENTDRDKIATEEVKSVTLEEEVNPGRNEILWFRRGIFFVCKECNERCNGRRLFRDHIARNHGIKISPNNMKSLKHHATQYDETSEYKCKECGDSCKFDELGISTHIRKHNMTITEYGDKHDNQVENSFKIPPVKKDSDDKTRNPVKPCLAPVGSDKSDISSSSGSRSSILSGGRLATVYLCPVTYTGTDRLGGVLCTFKTSKEGMKLGEAAKHLCQDHKIRPSDMKPGQFKFTKIKTEI